MIARIMYSSGNPNEQFEKLVECDAIDRVVKEDGTLILDFLKGGQIVLTQTFNELTDDARIFIMEKRP